VVFLNNYLQDIISNVKEREEKIKIQQKEREEYFKKRRQLKSLEEQGQISYNQYKEIKKNNIQTSNLDLKDNLNTTPKNNINSHNNLEKINSNQSIPNNMNNQKNDNDLDINEINSFNLDKYIRRVPNYPKEGILFFDITTLIKNKDAFQNVIKRFANRYRNSNIDIIVSAESRGFIFGSALAYELGCGFVPARKPGKLPSKAIRAEYTLEYGTDCIEIHKDAINQGDNVLIVDDLIATGGTIKAIASLVNHLGGNIIELAFVIDLINLHEDIGHPYYSILKYEVNE
jgi:adenine phosphoribosyltransferase